MRHTRIKTTNFLSHKDTELNLKDIEALVAVGPNGSGKSSFLVDSFLLAAFGKGRKVGDQERSDIDAYMRNGADLMTIERDFDILDKHYRIIFKRSTKTARGSSNLEFYEIDGEGNVLAPLTQGTIAETRTKIEKTIGADFDTLVRTSILEQGEATTFIDATPSGRMELIMKVWDLNRYDGMAEIARGIWLGRKDSPGLQAKILAFEEKIRAANQRISEIDQKGIELESTKKEIEKQTSIITPLEKKKETLQKKIGSLETVSGDLNKARENKNSAEQEIKKLTDQHAQVLAKIERYTKILQNQETVRAKVTEEAEKNKILTETEEEIKGINRKIEAVRLAINEIRSSYETKLRAAESEKQSIEALIEQVKEKEKEIHKSIELPLQLAEAELRHLCLDSDKLAGIQCHPDYDSAYINESCRFIKDAAEAKRRIPELEARIKLRRESLASDLATLASQLSDLGLKKVDCLSTMEDIRKDREKAVSDKDGVVSDLISTRDGLDKRIDGLKSELQEIKRFTKLLPEIDLAEKEIPGLKEEETSLANRCTEKVSDRDKYHKQIEELNLKITESRGIEENLKSVNKDLEAANSKKAELTKKLGSIEGELSQKTALHVQIEADQKKMEEAETEKALFQLLEEALKQIPFMLVNRSIGALEGITNEILSLISSTGLTVKLDTQKMTKTTAKIRDEIHVSYRDNEGSKQILSGGEKLRVAFATRLAISEILAHRRGLRIDSLIADEPFGALDHEGIEDMKEALRELKKRFKFMAVITHIDGAKDIFPVTLDFHKDGDQGTSIEMITE
jgi:exonuclease SbcC